MRRPESPATPPAPSYRPPDASDIVAYGYTIDGEDRITGIDAAWAAFAVENGAPGLPARVIGTRLREHIADATTRLLYRDLFLAVREHGRPVRVPFRCDAPGLVREMELEIAPAAERGLSITVRLLRERERAPIALLDPSAPRAGRSVRMCGWCKRVEVDGTWRDLEEAVAAMGLFRTMPVPPVTHGICASCKERVEAAMDEGDEG